MVGYAKGILGLGATNEDIGIGNAPSFIISGPWVSNNGAVLQAAAIAGLGIVYLPRVNVAQGLDSGKLVPILEEFWDRERNTWIVYPSHRHLPLRVRRAIDFLCDRFQAEGEPLVV
ncbi:MAG: LysR substrate-binding domain-containing protein [Cyanobacteria bacterium J06639_1]